MTISNANNSITVTLCNDDYESNDSYSYDFGSSDTIALSDLTLGGNSNVGITGIGVPWTTTTGISETFTLGSSWNQPASGKIKLDGPDADIEVNGQSLMTMLSNIEQRLNILQPNKSLESEWEELRSLGEQYRALEKHILEKQAIWDRLKAMPPPEID
jgi:hypothetical protein